MQGSTALKTQTRPGFSNGYFARSRFARSSLLVFGDSRYSTGRASFSASAIAASFTRSLVFTT
jgi:hypothetical protein